MKLGPIWEFSVLQADRASRPSSPLTECLWALCFISSRYLCPPPLCLPTHKASKMFWRKSVWYLRLWLSIVCRGICIFCLAPGSLWASLSFSPHSHLLPQSSASWCLASEASSAHYLTSSLGGHSQWLIPMRSPFLDTVTGDHQAWDAQIFKILFAWAYAWLQVQNNKYNVS